MPEYHDPLEASADYQPGGGSGGETASEAAEPKEIFYQRMTAAIIPGFNAWAEELPVPVETDTEALTDQAVATKNKVMSLMTEEITKAKGVSIDPAVLVKMDDEEQQLTMRQLEDVHSEFLGQNLNVKDILKLVYAHDDLSPKAKDLVEKTLAKIG